MKQAVAMSGGGGGGVDVTKLRYRNASYRSSSSGVNLYLFGIVGLQTANVKKLKVSNVVASGRYYYFYTSSGGALNYGPLTNGEITVPDNADWVYFSQEVGNQYEIELA